jgi:hypothetical protein
MKKLVIISNLALVLLASCVTQKTGTSTYNDDVYANPSEDRIADARLAEVKRQEQQAVDKRYNDSIAKISQAQKQKDDANPYYKDRAFKYDDYYDYEYATRVKRFNNNINGLGYYDNYYTNSYWYNHNPYNYGVSVYNGYSWWGSSYNSYSYNPSVNFYNNWGWGCNSGYGYNGYNPYMASYNQGYNNGFNNGYFGNNYGYGNPYGFGSSFGYNGYGNNYGYNGYGNNFGYGGYGSSNPYSGGWGYYNSKDLNSSYTYGPRESHGGGNSHRTSNPGVSPNRGDSYYEKYVDAVKDQQIHTVKFSEPETPRIKTNEPIRVNNSGIPIGTGGIKSNHTPIDNNGDVPVRGNNPIRTGEINDPIRTTPIRNGNLTPIEQTTPVKQIAIKTYEPVKQQIETNPRYEAPVRNNNNYQTPSFPSNNGGNSPGNNGGGNSPSNNGGGHRPR